jgi:hypothetical protein
MSAVFNRHARYVAAPTVSFQEIVDQGAAYQSAPNGEIPKHFHRPRTFIAPDWINEEMPRGLLLPLAGRTSLPCPTRPDLWNEQGIQFTHGLSTRSTRPGADAGVGGAGTSSGYSVGPGTYTG